MVLGKTVVFELHVVSGHHIRRCPSVERPIASPVIFYIFVPGQPRISKTSINDARLK